MRIGSASRLSSDTESEEALAELDQAAWPTYFLDMTIHVNIGEAKTRTDPRGISTASPKWRTTRAGDVAVAVPPTGSVDVSWAWADAGGAARSTAPRARAATTRSRERGLREVTPRRWSSCVSQKFQRPDDRRVIHRSRRAPPVHWREDFRPWPEGRRTREGSQGKGLCQCLSDGRSGRSGSIHHSLVVL